ncbi:hypothetical protein D7030_02265 [Flavobacteriaceae bacterium AU392]|nr:hypothetical protein D1817_08740 [Flavobacteriaceae bacterium]RKM85520.1 hypothetical protein D7030_02265 [Flavobacteriaceae bacterium AU392]
MKKVTSLLLAFVALAVLVFSFITNQETAQIFGISLNVWLYRLIWVAVGVISFLDYKKSSKNN